MSAANPSAYLDSDLSACYCEDDKTASYCKGKGWAVGQNVYAAGSDDQSMIKTCIQEGSLDADCLKNLGMYSSRILLVKHRDEGACRD